MASALSHAMNMHFTIATCHATVNAITGIVMKGLDGRLHGRMRSGEQTCFPEEKRKIYKIKLFNMPEEQMRFIF